MDESCTCAPTKALTHCARSWSTFQARSAGFPHQLNLWRCCHFLLLEWDLDLLLQSMHWVSFHDLLRRLSCNLHFFSEDVPDSRLRGWLGAGLDPAQARECEDAGLFHLLASDLYQ